jgi:uncharacterized protein
VSATLRSSGVGRLLALVLLMLAAFALPAAAQTFPKFTGLVVDDAGVLPEQTKAELTTKLEALQKDTKRQLVVVTIRDMGGEDLAGYTNKLFRAWGVGLNDIDNGVVLLLAPNNPAGQRGPRIEVGYGLEPVLTDALSSVIINQDMMPRLKAGDIPGAVTAGVDAIGKQLRASPEEAQSRQDAAVKEFDRTHRRERAGGSGGGFPLGLVFWGLVIGFVLLSVARRGNSRMGSGGRRYRSSGAGTGMASGLGQVVLWGIANEIASNAFRSGGGDRDDGVRGWDGGGGGWGGGGSDGSWGGGGFTGGGGGDSGGGGASGSW